eukprot:TRINITY_DN26643_c1_g1_i2.p1 TRINITY_DN26643_c1_g1~~TRINITY_DN26643_c1_g1_i2.p1  ORF type:complete len:195 (+),score=-20.58 TRINITY_DN26643_c1_g1_i2:296-880(+)
MRSWYQLFNLFLQQYKSTIHLYKFAKTQINLVEILLKTFRFFFFHNTMQPQLTKKSNHCSTLNKIIKQSIQIVQYTSTYQYISHIQPFFFNWINTVFFQILNGFFTFFDYNNCCQLSFFTHQSIKFIYVVVLPGSFSIVKMYFQKVQINRSPSRPQIKRAQNIIFIYHNNQTHSYLMLSHGIFDAKKFQQFQQF